MLAFFFVLTTLAFCVVIGLSAKRLVSLYLGLGLFFFVVGGIFLLSHGYHWPGMMSLGLGTLGAVGIVYMTWEESQCSHD